MVGGGGRLVGVCVWGGGKIAMWGGGAVCIRKDNTVTSLVETKHSGYLKFVFTVVI